MKTLSIRYIFNYHTYAAMIVVPGHLSLRDLCNDDGESEIFSHYKTCVAMSTSLRRELSDAAYGVSIRYRRRSAY